MAKSKITPADAKRRFASLSRKLQKTTRSNAAAIKSAARTAALKEAKVFKAAALKAARKFSADYATAGRKVAQLKMAQFKADLQSNLGRGSTAEVRQAKAKFVAICAAATKVLKKAPFNLGNVIVDAPLGHGRFDRGRPPSNHGTDRRGGDAGDEHTDGADE